MFRTNTLLGVALALLIGISANAQDIYLDASIDGSTIYTDGAMFYDSGRETEKYSNYEDYRTTICSESGSPLLVEFYKFYTEDNKDLLYISFGEGLDMRPVPGSPFSGDDLKKQVITSSETCMTFRIVTDFNSTRGGWKAEISALDPMVEMK